ncbi:hypothetical protein ACXWN6_10320, partial [Streptococcus pyogenes]
GEAFVRACEALLAEGGTARRERQAGMARLVARNSWNDTADAIHALLTQALVGVREALADAAPESEPMPLAASA